ncbi:hypothetical protein AAG570_002871 [Ranatra chinensis]|uniref:Uncharacterized protein n=1 Tax=Ranatra chinensis TaxID=642074 RepID=A0ABD0Y5R6_9HEMI
MELSDHIESAKRMFCNVSDSFLADETLAEFPRASEDGDPSGLEKPWEKFLGGDKKETGHGKRDVLKADRKGSRYGISNDEGSAMKVRPSGQNAGEKVMVTNGSKHGTVKNVGEGRKPAKDRHKEHGDAGKRHEADSRRHGGTGTSKVARSKSRSGQEVGAEQSTNRQEVDFKKMEFKEETSQDTAGRKRRHKYESGISGRRKGKDGRRRSKINDGCSKIFDEVSVFNVPPLISSMSSSPAEGSQDASQEWQTGEEVELRGATRRATSDFKRPGKVERSSSGGTKCHNVDVSSNMKRKFRPSNNKRSKEGHSKRQKIAGGKDLLKIWMMLEKDPDFLRGPYSGTRLKKRSSSSSADTTSPAKESCSEKASWVRAMVGSSPPGRDGKNKCEVEAEQECQTVASNSKFPDTNEVHSDLQLQKDGRGQKKIKSRGKFKAPQTKCESKSTNPKNKERKKSTDKDNGNMNIEGYNIEWKLVPDVGENKSGVKSNLSSVESEVPKTEDVGGKNLALFKLVYGGGPMPRRNKEPGSAVKRMRRTRERGGGTTGTQSAEGPMPEEAKGTTENSDCLSGVNDKCADSKNMTSGPREPNASDPLGPIDRVGPDRSECGKISTGQDESPQNGKTSPRQNPSILLHKLDLDKFMTEERNNEKESRQGEIQLRGGRNSGQGGICEDSALAEGTRDLSASEGEPLPGQPSSGAANQLTEHLGEELLVHLPKPLPAGENAQLPEKHSLEIQSNIEVPKRALKIEEVRGVTGGDSFRRPRSMESGKRYHASRGLNLIGHPQLRSCGQFNVPARPIGEFARSAGRLSWEGPLVCRASSAGTNRPRMSLDGISGECGRGGGWEGQRPGNALVIRPVRRSDGGGCGCGWPGLQQTRISLPEQRGQFRHPPPRYLQVPRSFDDRPTSGPSAAPGVRAPFGLGLDREASSQKIYSSQEDDMSQEAESTPPGAPPLDVSTDDHVSDFLDGLVATALREASYTPGPHDPSAPDPAQHMYDKLNLLEWPSEFD